MPSVIPPVPPDSGSLHDFRRDPCRGYTLAANRSWQEARLARLIGDHVAAAALRDQALLRARAAARCREKARGWSLGLL